METRTKIILGSIVLATGVVLALILRPSPQVPQSPLSPQPPLSSQENSGGNVTVTVTPVTLKQGLPPSFDVAFETHSVDLTFDVEKVASLTDGTRTVYAPHWDGTPAGGHHRSGTLRFTPDMTESRSVTLTLKDITDIPMRTFTWEVNQ